jgi:hypothetical protein
MGAPPPDQVIEEARTGERFGHQDRLLVDQRRGGLEVEDTWRRRHESGASPLPARLFTSGVSAAGGR